MSLELNRLTQVFRMYFEAVLVNVVDLTLDSSGPPFSFLGAQIISNKFQGKTDVQRFDMLNRCIMLAELGFKVQKVNLKASTPMEQQLEIKKPGFIAATYPLQDENDDDTQRLFSVQNIEESCETRPRSVSFYQPNNRHVRSRTALLMGPKSPTRDIDRVGGQSRPLEHDDEPNMGFEMVRIASRSPPLDEPATFRQRSVSVPKKFFGLGSSRYEDVQERRSSFTSLSRVPNRMVQDVEDLLKPGAQLVRARAGAFSRSPLPYCGRHGTPQPGAQVTRAKTREEIVEAAHFSAEDRADIDAIAQQDVDIGECTCLVPENLRRLDEKLKERDDSTPKSGIGAINTPSTAARASATPGSGLMNERTEFVDSRDFSCSTSSRDGQRSADSSPSSMMQESSHSERPPLRRQARGGQRTLAPESMARTSDSYFPASSCLSPMDPTTEELRPGSSGCEDVGIPASTGKAASSIAESSETITPPIRGAPKWKTRIADRIKSVWLDKRQHGWPSFTEVVERTFAKKRRASQDRTNSEGQTACSGQPIESQRLVPAVSVGALSSVLVDGTAQAFVQDAQERAAASQAAN